ncbi:MAG: response regulator transcription factor [Saprospiraceae bacterium]|nr:response regulator transcription factor [Saprospiraceae bacterium]
MKILLIEDEPELAASISDFLKVEGYLVELALDFPTAHEKAVVYEYDCLIVDINGSAGLDAIRALKKLRSEAATIIISARNALDERIVGLDLGADDYLTKPLYLPELNARLKALLLRRHFGGSSDIVFHEIKVKSAQRSVYVNETLLDLTPKEYDLLLYFFANQHCVPRRESIAEHLLSAGLILAGMLVLVWK